MATLYVEGTYRDGTIELDERPEGVPPAVRVLVAIPTGEHLPLPRPAEIDEDRRREAIRRLAEDMKAGLDLGGAPYPTREEIYAERLDRYPSDPR